MKEIYNSVVLFVTFEKQDGRWVAKIPHAYGKGEHFVAPVDEKLSFQFHPVIRINGKQEKVLSVLCWPLEEVASPEK